jgi:hypothetical protein
MELENSSTSQYSEVGTTSKPNPWGLHDMVSSLPEALFDKPRNYDHGGTALNKSVIDPVGPIPIIPAVGGRRGGWVVANSKANLPQTNYMARATEKRCADRAGDRGLGGFRIVLAKPIQ